MAFEVSNLYREFQTAEEAELWAEKHYAGLCGGRRARNPDYELLYKYAGNGYRIYNQTLRRDWKDDEEDLYDIAQLTALISKYDLSEPVVAYRYTNRRDIMLLCGGKKLCAGLRFSDKAFFSTSLVKSSLVTFRKENQCDCLLKLYLPKGLHTVYISLKDTDSRLNEQELLLQRDTEFEIVKIHRFSIPMVIECEARV